MNLGHGSVVRPGTARVQVTELSGSGYINPTPKPTQSYEDSDTAAVEMYLSPERLKLLCETQDLSLVTSLEVCVDTRQNTLGNFGIYLPRLEQLKMNNSSIMSVRDLGTTLSHLQVLWLSRCCLQDIDGISYFASLKEFYLAYNNVSDLSPISMLENLQLLDLEGNNVDDLVQVQYLSLCLKLQTLTLEGNPVCVRPNPTSSKVDYCYRAAVRELVPQLRYLDDVKVEEDRLTCCSITGEDWDFLRNSIMESNSSEAAKKRPESVQPHSTHSSAGRPFTSPSGVRLFSSPSSRLTLATSPGAFSSPGSRPGSSDSDLATVEAETSLLTHGSGKVLFCGNPAQALRAKREKLKTAPARSTLTPRDLPIHVPEHTYDLDDSYFGERVDVFAELRAWREQHSRRLEIIEKERLPQILTIHQGDGDEEEGSFYGTKNISNDEGGGDEKQFENLHTGSPDSSFQSLSPELDQREASSPDLARLSLSSKIKPSDSPPLCSTSADANKKLQGIRARRLRLSQTGSQHFSDVSREGCSHQTPAAETDLMSERIQYSGGNHVPPVLSITHRPHPPSVSAQRGKPISSCWDVDSSSKQLDRKHMSRIQDRPAVSRPHTARAALQTHRQHHLLQPYRGSSQPD